MSLTLSANSLAALTTASGPAMATVARRFRILLWSDAYCSMEHVDQRVAGHDLFLRAPVGRAVGVEEPAVVDAQTRQLPAHSTFTDAYALLREFECDPAGGPLVVPPQLLDPFDDVGRGLGR